jgi:hypothetical protein
MDVKQYYRKLREIEASINDPFVFVSSLETADGGKPGVIAEVSREHAAKLIAEGRARLANDAESAVYLDKRDADKKAFEKAELARRLQVTIVSKSDSSANESSETRLRK